MHLKPMPMGTLVAPFGKSIHVVAAERPGSIGNTIPVW